jgi:beta-aspartyl-peptidase (threonine type)
MPQAVIAIHGGAGTITRAAMDAEREREYTAALEQVLLAGQRVLADGGSALDAVTEAVRLLEDCPLFNAGRGAVLTHAGTYELDAAVMDGATLGAGAVACVKRLRNPVLAARAVLERSEHVLFAAEGAEAFAEAQGLELVGPDYYFTQARHDQWLRAQASTGMALLDHDAAALAARAGLPIRSTRQQVRHGRRGGLRCRGNLAAATSTGGVTNKQVGRVGDTPIVGRRLLRRRRRGGLGHGHRRDVHPHRGRVRRVGADALRGLSLEESARRVVMEKLPAIGGRGGLIAVDRAGNVTLPFNTEGMYRGVARVGEPVNVWIYG